MVSQPKCRFLTSTTGTVRTIQFAFLAMRQLPRFGMKPISRNMSKIMYAIWSFSITLVNHAECQRSTVWRKGRNIPQFSVSASSLRSLVNAGDLRRTKIGSE